MTCRSKSTDQESFKITVTVMSIDFISLSLLLIQIPTDKMDKLYA